MLTKPSSQVNRACYQKSERLRLCWHIKHEWRTEDNCHKKGKRNSCFKNHGACSSIGQTKSIHGKTCRPIRKSLRSNSHRISSFNGCCANIGFRHVFQYLAVPFTYSYRGFLPQRLHISVPATVFVAITIAARRGVIIKGGIYVEKFAKVKRVVFDKTGTLTLGRPSVHEVRLVQRTEEEALAYGCGT